MADTDNDYKNSSSYKYKDSTILNRDWNYSSYMRYLEDNYSWFSDLPEEYKNRILQNPHWQSYAGYKESGWDALFHPTKAINKRNELLGNVDNYIMDVYTEWQKYVQNLPQTQKANDILAGINPVFQDYSGAGGPVESQNNTTPVDLSSNDSQEAIAVVQTALSAIAAAMTNGISLVGTMAANALSAVQKQSVEHDNRLKKLTLFSNAVKFIKDNGDVFVNSGDVDSGAKFVNLPSSGDAELDEYLKKFVTQYNSGILPETTDAKVSGEFYRASGTLDLAEIESNKAAALNTAISNLVSDDGELTFYRLYGDANLNIMMATLKYQELQAKLDNINASSEIDYMEGVQTLSRGKSYGTLAAESDFYQIQMQKQVNEFTAKARQSLFDITNYIFDQAAKGKRWAQALSLGLGGATLFTPTFNFQQRQAVNPRTGDIQTLNDFNASIQ